MTTTVAEVPVVKPGYKTTEFWMSLAGLIIGSIAASGMIPEGGAAARIIGLIMDVLVALGYTASRTALKQAAAR